MGLFPGQTAGQTECLILGNGPSLLDRDWKTVPRERVMVFGVNQSWRVVKDADAHVSIDHDQYVMANPAAQAPHEYFPEAKAYYEDMGKRGVLYCTNGGAGVPFGARALDRHDALTFSRKPFQKRHRGAHTKPPRLEEDGGVVLKVGHESGGSTCYIALQIAAAMKFERIWFVGLNLTGGKFTGKKSNSEKHDRLWKHVPADVRARVRVIGPSATQVFTVVDWPWVRSC